MTTGKRFRRKDSGRHPRYEQAEWREGCGHILSLGIYFRFARLHCAAQWKRQRESAGGEGARVGNNHGQPTNQIRSPSSGSSNRSSAPAFRGLTESGWMARGCKEMKKESAFFYSFEASLPVGGWRKMSGSCFIYTACGCCRHISLAHYIVAYIIAWMLHSILSVYIYVYNTTAQWDRAKWVCTIDIVFHLESCRKQPSLL